MLPFDLERKVERMQGGGNGAFRSAAQHVRKSDRRSAIVAGISQHDNDSLSTTRHGEDDNHKPPRPGDCRMGLRDLKRPLLAECAAVSAHAGTH